MISAMPPFCLLKLLLLGQVLLGLFSEVAGAFQPLVQMGFGLKIATCPKAAMYSSSSSSSDSDVASSPSQQQPQQQDESSISSSDSRKQISMESLVRDNYPDFYKLLTKNENIFQQLEKDHGGCYTIFAPNAQAFENLGEKRRMQLDDPRNVETAQKMGLYHIVGGEALSITNLNREDWTVPKDPTTGLPALKFGALVTLGGEVPIGRTKKKIDGGFFRSLVGKKKTDRDAEGNPKTVIVLGPGGVIQRSLTVGNVVLNEVDDLISPLVLWRYCDQLRIPGF